MINGYGYDPTQDQGTSGPNGRSPGVWYTVTIVRTPDGWTHAYINDILDWRFRAEYVGEVAKSIALSIRAISEVGADNGDAHIDSLQVYNHKYFFPMKGIEFGQYVSNNYIGSDWGIKSMNKSGIIVKGRNITLSDIADAINNPSLFTYDAKTKTAISYTNLFLYYGSELVIKDETLKFHCESDGEIEFAVGYGATLKIENSTVTSDNEHYFVWNFASASTHFGYPLGREDMQPRILNFVSYNSIIIDNSVINNSAYLFFQSPLELKITNSQITDLHETDIGNYDIGNADWGQKNAIQDTKGEKSLQIYTESSNLYDFDFRNVIISAKNSPVNITFKVNAYRDKLNIYNINAENENIVLDNPYSGTGAPGGQSHTCYNDGYPYQPGYIHAGIGLVNCKFKDIIINESVKHACDGIGPGCDGRAVVKNAAVKYYLDVKVIDEDGPVEGANVTVTNEVDDTNYPPENMDIYRYWTRDCDYDYLRIKMGLPVHTLTTGSDGHTPLPSDMVINTTITYRNITTDKP
ncbi:MAG: hypothetical protein DRO93_15770, partial [Candidatus Thorarchaeota archaeon]